MKMSPNPESINSTYPSSGARTTFSLNSAYVANTSGAGIAIRYSAIDTTPINEFYVYVDSFTGTKANVSMQCVLYNENSTNAARAGTTVRATSTATTIPSGSAGWTKFVFGSPYTPAQGEVLWFVVTNTAAAPATDFPNVLNAISVALGTYGWAAGYTNTAGFSTNGTAVAKMPFIMQQGGIYYGQPYTAISTPTTTTVKRGIIVTPEVDVVIGSYENGGFTSAMTNITIHESTQFPNDTPVYTYVLGGTNKVSDKLNGAVALTPYTLRKGKTYYVCIASSSATTTPLELSIEDYSTYSTVFNSFIDGITCCGKVLDSGSNTWTIDYSKTQRVALLVELAQSNVAAIICNGGV